MELYRKYRKDYKIDEILEGSFTEDMLEKLKFAPFDERLSIVHLLNGKLNEFFMEYAKTDAYVSELFSWLKDYMEHGSMEETLKKAESEYRERKKAEQISKEEEHIWKKVIGRLETYLEDLKREKPQDEPKAVRSWFKAETESREQLVEKISDALLYAFDFMEAAFGDGQEMVVFITELNVNYYSVDLSKKTAVILIINIIKACFLMKDRKGFLSRLKTR